MLNSYFYLEASIYSYFMEKLSRKISLNSLETPAMDLFFK